MLTKSGIASLLDVRAPQDKASGDEPSHAVSDYGHLPHVIAQLYLSRLRSVHVIVWSPQAIWRLAEVKSWIGKSRDLPYYR
jgi:hypothetical protein